MGYMFHKHLAKSLIGSNSEWRVFLDIKSHRKYPGFSKIQSFLKSPNQKDLELLMKQVIYVVVLSFPSFAQCEKLKNKKIDYYKRPSTNNCPHASNKFKTF